MKISEKIKQEKSQTCTPSSTRSKWIHQSTEESKEEFILSDNLKELPFLKTWGYLNFLDGGDLIPLTSENQTYIIGRSPSADIALTDEEYLSPEHVKIHLRVTNPIWSGDQKVTIQDLGSLNGTKKNGISLLNGPEVLLHEDVIELVSFDFTFSFNCKPLSFQFLKAECPSLHKEYQILGQLGSGGSASVKKVKSITTGEVRAIKLLPKSKSGDLKRDTLYKREVALMKRLSHPYIIELVGITESRQEIGLVLPIAPCGDLNFFCKGRTLDNVKLVQIHYQLLTGLSFLHDFGLIHRDIKPKNILVFCREPPILKIADFGTIKFYKPSKPPSVCVGTPYYVAPEIFGKRYGRGYTPKCDLFSVGVMFFQSVTSKLPFAEHLNRVNHLQVESAILSKSHLFSRNGLKLLCSLLVLDPTKRLSTSEALKLPFFTDNPSILDSLREYEARFKARPNTN